MTTEEKSPQRPSAVTAPVIYTIGHSNHTAAGMINMLKLHGITRVIDVRSYPKSRYVPHFNRETLENSLAGEGIYYQYEGDALGGRPARETLYRDGTADYARMAQEEGYRTRLEELAATAAHAPTAIMCTERDPEKCHRSLLIGESLTQMGIRVVHIKPRRVTVSQEELVNELKGKLGDRAVAAQSRAVGYRRP